MDRTEESTGTAEAQPVQVPCTILTRCLRRDRPTTPTSSHALLGVRAVHIGRGSVNRAERVVLDGEPTLRLAVADPRVSTSHARLVRRHRAWVLTDLGSTNGTRVAGRAILAREGHTLADDAVFEVGQTSFHVRHAQPIHPGRDPLDLDAVVAEVLPGWRTHNRVLRATFERLVRLAESAQNLLVLGPSGSGKERIATGIHAASGRRGAFIACNCATLTGDLAAGALFGHARGAFTGAVAGRDGLLRAAHGGTVFLDEIGALPEAVQAQLLRVLETGEVRPLGQDRAWPIDVRVVAATLDPSGLRPDLRMRIAQSTVELPPMRHRKEDLGLALGEILTPETVRFDGLAAAALFAHTWPGNWRELVNLMGELTVVSQWRAQRIGRADLPAWAQTSAAPDPDAAQRARLQQALRETRGNVKAAAAALGVSRQQFYVLARRLGVDPNAHR